VAVATTIATTFTTHFVDDHPGASQLGAHALTHGFAIAFYVLAALMLLGAIIAAVFIESKPAAPQEEVSGVQPELALEAA
jgi:hypothetical protein